MTDPFQVRAQALLLDIARFRPEVTRDLFNVFEVQDLSKEAYNQLAGGYSAIVSEGGVHPHSRATQAIIYKVHSTNAFWMHYLAAEDYSGSARCLINPPPGLLIDLDKSQDLVTITTDRGCGAYGTLIHTGSFVSSGPDGMHLPELLLKLNSIRGEEKGFFNEIVVFCNGLVGRQAPILADMLAKHILPQTTAFIFEVPNAECGLWASLFEPLPETDVAALIEAIGSKTGFVFHQIKVNQVGPRTIIYFGVDVQDQAIDKA